MNIRQTTDIAAFAELALPFLRQRPAENNLLLALMRSLLQGDLPTSKPALISVEQDGEIVAVAMQTEAQPLVLSRMAKATYVDAVVHHIKTQWPSKTVPLRQSLGQFSGPKAETALFAQTLRRWTRLRYHISSQMRIYQLDQASLESALESTSYAHASHSLATGGATGQLRRAESSDRDLLIRWCRDFELESFGEQQTDPEIWSDRNLAQQILYLWETEQGPVCMIAGSGDPKTVDGASIGPLYTAPAYRCQGHGTAATVALSRELLNFGCKYCYLFTNLNHATSNHIYQRIGYRPVCDWNTYQFRA